MQPDKIRVAVTPPSGHQEIPKRAEDELGFEISMRVVPTEALFETLLSGDDAFDMVQVEVWMIEELARRKLIVPIAASAVERYHDISPVFTAGVLKGYPVGSCGTAPWSVLFADEARRQDAAWLNFVPTVCNADTLGWRTDRVKTAVESWAALVDEQHSGRVALADVPAVSHVELALALQAAGLVDYADIGEHSAEEIEATYEALRSLRANHFHSIWATYEDSVHAMSEGPVAVQSCWPPAIAEMRGRDIPVQYSPLKEGGRGWAGGYVFMRSASTAARERALLYANWYLDGWAGAYLSRQGYYSAAPTTAKVHLAPAEWSYWYEGEAAEGDVRNPAWQIIDRAGGRREGGSFFDRMGRIACWNTRMAEDALIREHWSKFRSGIGGAVHKPPISQS